MEYLPKRRAVVAIPARDEEDRIDACLEALDMQDGARIDAIVLFVNNTVDRTAQVAQATRLHRGTRLQVIERDLPPHQANAGIARRIAMQEAARLAGPAGVLLTTDADGLVDPDWLVANLAAIKAGADAVAGWCELHPVEWGAIPASCMRMMRASVPTTRCATKSMAGWILILRTRYRDIRSIPAPALPSRQPHSRGVAAYLQYLPVRTEPSLPLCAV